MATTASARTVLLVSDWAVDPHSVVAAAARAANDGATFHLLVPAWLHGLDWAGDPRASRPCAHAHLERLTRMLTAAGLTIAEAEVGDPDPVTAIADAVDGWRADAVVLCAHGRRLLAQRARRATGLPVQHVDVARPRGRRRGHCLATA